MIAFLLGLQGSYTKHSCLLCLWNSRADKRHYLVKNWPARKGLTPGSHNVLNSSLVERSKILLSPLHIKLGLAKQFVKALKPTSRAFRHIRHMFPSISEAKLKLFVGPQIKRMLASEELKEQMSNSERNTLQAFRMIVEGFLGNHRRDDYALYAMVEYLYLFIFILHSRESELYRYFWTRRPHSLGSCHC